MTDLEKKIERLIYANKPGPTAASNTPANIKYCTGRLIAAIAKLVEEEKAV